MRVAVVLMHYRYGLCGINQGYVLIQAIPDHPIIPGGAANGKIVADSAEGYRNRQYAAKMARALFPGASLEWAPR